MSATEVNQYKRTPTRLRLWRVYRCLKQRELAAAAGVSRVTVNRLEAGHQPSPKTANALAYALGVSVSDLFPEDVDERDLNGARTDSS